MLWKILFFVNRYRYSFIEPDLEPDQILIIDELKKWAGFTTWVDK